MGECKFKKKEGNNSNNKKEKTARQVCQSRNTFFGGEGEINFFNFPDLI